MNAESIPASQAGRSTAFDPPSSIGRAASRFYSGMASALLLVVFAGFAPTLYLRPLFDAPAVGPHVWLHAGVLTAWFVAFWLQAALIGAQRVALHRRLGWLVAAIALGAIGTSVQVTIAAVAAGSIMPRTAWSNLANAAAFAVLLAAAMALRRDRDTHKRLMLLTSIAFVQPAAARLFRWPPLADLGLSPLVGGLVLSLLFLLPLAVYDVATRRRLHAATLIGGIGLIAARLVAVFAIAGSSLGRSVLQWLT